MKKLFLTLPLFVMASCVSAPDSQVQSLSLGCGTGVCEFKQNPKGGKYCSCEGQDGSCKFECCGQPLQTLNME